MQAENWSSPALRIVMFIFTKDLWRSAQVNLDGATTVAEIQNRLREYAAKHPGDSWILGRGWNYAVFGEDRFAAQEISR